MKNKIKVWLIKLAFKILTKYHVRYYLVEESELQHLVDRLVGDVEKKFGSESGEFKRAQVMRAAMNSDPEASERDIALAIEISVRTKVF